jgi:hypothetical protein
MIKAASILAWAPGLGFGLPWSTLSGSSPTVAMWTFMGFPTYGPGRPPISAE